MVKFSLLNDAYKISRDRQIIIFNTIFPTKHKGAIRQVNQIFTGGEVIQVKYPYIGELFPRLAGSAILFCRLSDRRYFAWNPQSSGF